MRSQWFAVLLVCAGCPSAGDRVAEQTLGPVAAGTEIVLADLETGELVVLSTEAGEVDTIRRLALAGTPSALTALPDGSAVLALSDEAGALDLVTMPAGERRTYELGAPFAALAISPDSNACLAYFPPDATQTVFHNANEVAFVDLAAETPVEEAVTRRTLASLGGAPYGVSVSPQVEGRRYAFILSDGHVAVLDLSRPDTRERSVPLISLNSPSRRTPEAVAFGVDVQGALWGVVTTAEGNAAYALKVTDQAPSAPNEPPFAVVLNQLAGFSPGGEVGLMTLPDGRLVALLVSPSHGTATMTELQSGASKTLNVGAGVDRLVTYIEDGRPIALVFRAGGSAFHIVDVAAIEEKKDKAFRTRYAANSIDDLLAIPGSPLFFAFHPSTSKAVSVINADTDRITPFEKTGHLRQFVLSQTLDRVYLLTRLANRDYLVSVQLSNLHPQRTEVPDGADRLLLLPDAETVAVSATSPGGRLTLWPANATHDDHALAVPAFLLEGALDRAEGE